MIFRENTDRTLLHHEVISLLLETNIAAAFIDTPLENGRAGCSLARFCCGRNFQIIIKSHRSPIKIIPLVVFLVKVLYYRPI